MYPNYSSKPQFGRQQLNHSIAHEIDLLGNIVLIEMAIKLANQQNTSHEARKKYRKKNAHRHKFAKGRSQEPMAKSAIMPRLAATSMKTANRALLVFDTKQNQDSTAPFKSTCDIGELDKISIRNYNKFGDSLTINKLKKPFFLVFWYKKSTFASSYAIQADFSKPQEAIEELKSSYKYIFSLDNVVEYNQLSKVYKCQSPFLNDTNSLNGNVIYIGINQTNSSDLGQIFVRVNDKNGDQICDNSFGLFNFQIESEAKKTTSTIKSTSAIQPSTSSSLIGNAQLVEKFSTTNIAPIITNSFLTLSSMVPNLDCKAIESDDKIVFAFNQSGKVTFYKTPQNNSDIKIFAIKNLTKTIDEYCNSKDGALNFMDFIFKAQQNGEILGLDINQQEGNCSINIDPSSFNVTKIKIYVDYLKKLKELNNTKGTLTPDDAQEFTKIIDSFDKFINDGNNPFTDKSFCPKNIPVDLGAILCITAAMVLVIITTLYCMYQKNKEEQKAGNEHRSVLVSVGDISNDTANRTNIVNDNSLNNDTSITAPSPIDINSSFIFPIIADDHHPNREDGHDQPNSDLDPEQIQKLLRERADLKLFKDNIREEKIEKFKKNNDLSDLYNSLYLHLTSIHHASSIARSDKFIAQKTERFQGYTKYFSLTCEMIPVVGEVAAQAISGLGIALDAYQNAMDMDGLLKISTFCNSTNEYEVIAQRIAIALTEKKRDEIIALNEEKIPQNWKKFLKTAISQDIEKAFLEKIQNQSMASALGLYQAQRVIEYLASADVARDLNKIKSAGEGSNFKRRESIIAENIIENFANPDTSSAMEPKSSLSQITSNIKATCKAYCAVM